MGSASPNAQLPTVTACLPLSLACRRVHQGDSLEEWYLPGSRPDGLAHRSVQYAPAAAPAAPGTAASRPPSAVRHARPSAHLHRASVATAGWAEAADRDIACIREQHSGGAPGAAGPLLERCFDLADGRLTLAAPDPAGPGSTSRTYGERTAFVSCLCDMPAGFCMLHLSAAPPLPTVPRPPLAALDGALLEGPPAGTPEQQRREHVALRAASRAAQGAVQAAEDELRAILQAAQRAEQSCQLITPHYDAPRLRVGLAAGGAAGSGRVCFLGVGW